MNDTQILDLFFARNEQAIQQTAEQYGAYCGSIARNILQNDQDVEECLNDAWLGAWNSIPPKRPEHLASFLGRLTRNRAIDIRRTRTREKRGGDSVSLALEELAEVLPAGDDPEEQVMQKELSRCIDRFLSSLNETERRMFLCRYWYFDRIEDIARRFGCRTGTVKSALHRTRIKLRQYLQKEELL